jgi:hypothetical protein
MQNPTEQTKASIPTETTVNDNGNGSNKNHTVKEHRRAAKRTLPWDLQAGELGLVSPSQAEEIRAMKRPRLEQEPDVSVRLPPPPPPSATDNDDGNANVVLVSTDTQPNAGATTVTRRRWTSEEDTTLASAVANSSKKKYGKEYKINWAAIATLVLSKTSTQCRKRWNAALDPDIDRASGRKGSWPADEISKLKDAVQTHDGKDWGAIAALVPGRTENQCRSKWHSSFVSNINPTTAQAGRWTADEDKKLKDAVQTHGGKDWAAISALVPGRTKKQCWDRWKNTLNPNIALTAGREGRWTADEDSKLKDAVRTNGGKDWAAIAALVPGRAQKVCCSRWHDVLNPSIDRVNGRTGKWAEDEDSKLKEAVQTHGVKNWVVISALIPGRTKRQCYNKWRKSLKPKIGRESGRTVT